MKVTWYKSREEWDEGEKELMDCLKKLEQVLGERPYFGGGTLGYLDVVLGGFCSWFCAYDEALGNTRIEDECPKLMAWTKRCMERHSFSNSINPPHKIAEFVLQLRKRNGLATI